METISLERQERGEEDELLRFLKNSCMSCRKDFGKNEIRVLPSSYIQERDFYVRSGIVDKRLLCIDCYNSLKKGSRVRTRKGKPLRKQGIRRLFSSRGFLSETLLGQ